MVESSPIGVGHCQVVFQDSLLKMILFIVVTCGIAATVAAGVVDDKDKTESLSVSEGGNLTISIHIKDSDEDPQVLVTLTKGSSQELVAQLICHNGVCGREYGKPGVSLISEGDNVTLILMNVSYNQTGLYTVSRLSNSQPENIYNVTVYQPPLSTISSDLLPSAMHSKPFTVGLITAAVAIPVLITSAIIISVFYWKRRKANFYKVPQDDDTPASSRF